MAENEARRAAGALKSDLKRGSLSPLLRRVQRDRTLQLEFRSGYADVYYRGGCITKITPSAGGYRLSIDDKYFRHEDAASVSPPHCVDIWDAEGCTRWLSNLGRLKDEMDLWFGEHQKWEREAQQVLARENNCDGSGTASDYFILDIEYQHPAMTGRFDALAVHWPSQSAARMSGSDRRFAFVELKWGDHALDSGPAVCKSGIRKHVRDLANFVGTTGFDDLKRSMIDVFNDKRELELIPRAGRELESFSTDKPQLLFVLANHDPATSKLLLELEALAADPIPDGLELRFARSNDFGYALFHERLRSLDDVLDELRRDAERMRLERASLAGREALR